MDQNVARSPARNLARRAGKGYLKLPQLSMGTTNDFPIAVEEGATLVPNILREGADHSASQKPSNSVQFSHAAL